MMEASGMCYTIGRVTETLWGDRVIWQKSSGCGYLSMLPTITGPDAEDVILR